MFQPNRRIEMQYYRDILGIVRKFFVDPQGAVQAAFISLPDWLSKYARQAADRMITHQMSHNDLGWRAAAREAGKGRTIHEALQRELHGKVGRRYFELIDHNAKLIQSLPQQVASQFVREAAKREREGMRPQDIANSGLLKHLISWQAMRLARTEGAKANAALTQARAEDLGLNWYVWKTAEDERVRLSHRRMDGVLVNFNDPPSPERLVGQRTIQPYNAGNVFNCRCYMEILMRLDQIKWPHRVFSAGVIRYVGLAEFRNKNVIAATAA